MNLEEKAKKIEIYARNEDEANYVNFGFKQGYKCLKSDLLEFIRVNPKASRNQIENYLNEL